MMRVRRMRTFLCVARCDSSTSGTFLGVSICRYASQQRDAMNNFYRR